MTSFPLPHHPSCRSIDPLGLCDDIANEGDGTVSHADLLDVLLKQADSNLRDAEALPSPSRASWVTIFSGLVEDIAYGLNMDSSLKTKGLKDLLWSDVFSVEELSSFRKSLFSNATSLAEAFPGQSLEQLCEKKPLVVLYATQVDCFLAHLLLGTLQLPTGNTWGRPGFTSWFGGHEATAKTSQAYVRTIIQHFATGGYGASPSSDQRFTFQFSTGSDMPELSTSKTLAIFIPTTVVAEPSEPSARQDCFVLEAAHSQPGPGPGGTREERLVGQSPALAIASLLTPLLPPDAAVITSSLPVHSHWTGHGRDAQMMGLYPAASRPRRRYIIADARELDGEDSTGETSPAFIEREVRKLYAAFSGSKDCWFSEGNALRDLRIEMPPWGCGAFGGTLGVKAQCMMIAAGLAGLKPQNLEFLVPRGREQESTSISRDVVTVGELFESLTNAN